MKVPAHFLTIYNGALEALLGINLYTEEVATLEKQRQVPRWQGYVSYPSPLSRAKRPTCRQRPPRCSQPIRRGRADIVAPPTQRRTREDYNEEDDGCRHGDARVKTCG